MTNGQFWILGILICLVVSFIALLILEQSDEIEELKKQKKELLRNNAALRANLYRREER